MLLYILYIEPLLVALQAETIGFSMLSLVQKVEGFCNDVNLITNDESDFHVVEEVVTKFERPSGAILSRNKKCQAVGFGTWKSRTDWPVQWIRAVNSVKVFGIFISDSYEDMLKLKWDHRYKKFSDVI